MWKHARPQRHTDRLSLVRSETKALFIFPLTNLWMKHQAPRGIEEWTRAARALKPLSPNVSLSLYRSLSLSSQPLCSSTGQDTDKTHYLQHAPVTQIKDSQTRLIPSGWHSEIRRKSLSVNLALLAGLKAKQCTKTDLIRANTAVHF